MNRIANQIYERWKQRGWIPTPGVKRRFYQLHRGNQEEREAAMTAYYLQSIKMTLWGGVFWLVLAGVVFLCSFLGREQGIPVLRGDYGEEAKEISIAYLDESQSRKEVSLEVPAVSYREEEVEEAFDRAFSYAEERFLGNNSDLDCIREDLDLVDRIPGSGIEIRWEIPPDACIDGDGHVVNENLERPYKTQISMVLSYGELEQWRTYELEILPAVLSEEASEEKALEGELADYLAKQPYDRQITIPSDFGGVKLLGTAGRMGGGGILLPAGLVLLCLLVRRHSGLSEQRKKQQEAYLCAYPGFVEKLCLYLNAGTTVRGALARVTAEYERHGKQEEQLYAQLKILMNELSVGVHAEDAYMNFAKRIGVLPYMRCMSFLNQETRHGGGEVAKQLAQEATAAFEQRKERAIRKGEEAETKLLLPMILLMIASVLLVMVPAFLDFSSF